MQSDYAEHQPRLGAAFRCFDLLFSKAMAKIIVRIHEDCDNQFNQKQRCPIVKLIIPISSKTCASFR